MILSKYSKKLSIVTMTYNCIGEIHDYLDAFLKLDRNQFEWIVVDAGSLDGTAEILREHQHLFYYFISERDGGFYYGLNKALDQISTPYYMVFGADDRPHPELLSNLLPLLNKTDVCMLLGGVEIVPGNKIKLPGPRWMHRFVLGRAVSHHSVGTVINMQAHKMFGKYDTNYTLVADALLLKKY